MPPARGVAAIMILLAGACTSGADAPFAAPSRTAASHPSQQASASAAATSPTPPGADADPAPVTIAAADLTLAGDLRIPDGRGPHPGVVLLHGSGPNTRDGAVPGQLGMVFPRPVPVLADLAAALRDAGYAVVTYDKRTCGPFNGCADNGYPEPAEDLEIETFVDDAKAAVRFLRSRPEVEARSVAVAGHSQGATFVPGMLLDDPTLVAGVLLSAPYDPIDALLADQAETLARMVARLSPAPAAATGSVTQLRRLARSVSELRSGDAEDTTQVGGASVGFWRSWLRLSDGVPQLAAQAQQPLLVLSGRADTNIAQSQTARWRRKLSGDRDRVVELGCVSHALNCLRGDDPMAVDPVAIEAMVDPRVGQIVAAFLDEVVP